jgi:dTDP-4-dehydrorhamnose 3,5-epimerase
MSEIANRIYGVRKCSCGANLCPPVSGEVGCVLGVCGECGGLVEWERVWVCGGIRGIEGVIAERLVGYSDSRGSLLELYREDVGIRSVMGYMSWTGVGIGRGPHEHVYQTDVFVFAGPGLFRVSLWDNREGSATKGVVMSFDCGAGNAMRVVVPPGVVHGYRNISDVSGLVLNFPDRLYKGEGKKEDVDEIRHEDDKNSPFVLL